MLFPGQILPLHIFEPRYRRLLADCLAGDRRFGITRAGAPGPGTIGTVAGIQLVHALPDGRSNIVVTGGTRFTIDALRQADTPYLEAEARPFSDEPGTAPSSQVLADLRRTVGALRNALALIQDEPVPPLDPPEDAEALSFVAAALSETDLDTRDRLLALRSTGERVELLMDLLRSQARTVRERAAIHLRARSNGHGHAHEFDDGPDA